MPDGIRRIADDNFNARFQLFFDAFGIFFERVAKFFNGRLTFGVVVLFATLKSVGETNSLERRVTRGVKCGVVSVFDVDGGNVVGEQNNFVGVQFVQIFVHETARLNQARFNQSRNESSGACERVDDVHAAACETSPEIFFKYGVDGAQNKIDNFNGRVDDTELFDS